MRWGRPSGSWAPASWAWPWRASSPGDARQHRGGLGEGPDASAPTRPATARGWCTPASTTGRAASRPSCARAAVGSWRTTAPSTGCPSTPAASWSSPSTLDEIGRLDALERTARQNGVPGLRRVGPGEIRELEPHTAGLAALHSPATAITDYAVVAETMASELRAGGGDVRTSAAVTGIRRNGDGIVGPSGGVAHRVDRLVVCAGPAGRPRLALGRRRGRPADRAVPRRVPDRAAREALARARAWSIPCPTRATRSWACTSPAGCRASSRSARTPSSPSAGRDTGGTTSRRPTSASCWLRPASGGWPGGTGGRA